MSDETPKFEIPNGAIENGYELARRLEEHYDFECEAGPFRDCTEWREFKWCFKAMADALIEVQEMETAAPAMAELLEELVDDLCSEIDARYGTTKELASIDRARALLTQIKERETK